MKGLVYFPYTLNTSPTSGSGVRPLAILEGFRDAGIDVEVISGASGQRKRLIQQVKRTGLCRGLDWVYIESSTMPMALTDPDHIPRHPWMDAAFWRYCRSWGVPTGLFYRDVHWRFSQYDKVPLAKRAIGVTFYHIEWAQFERAIDHLFLPSEGMNEALLRPWSKDRMSALPPGCVIQENARETARQEGLTLLYVGGIAPPLYDLRPLFSAVAELPSVKLTICCREQEWLQYSRLYEPLRTENITITHRSSDGLRQLYDETDIVAIVWEGDPYLKFAMPVKLFEALGWGKPIITNAGTATADFVQREGIGWVATSQQEVSSLLVQLSSDRDRVKTMTRHVQNVRHKHTWKVRAETIAAVLESYKGRHRRDTKGA